VADSDFVEHIDDGHIRKRSEELCKPVLVVIRMRYLVWQDRVTRRAQNLARLLNAFGNNTSKAVFVKG